MKARVINTGEIVNVEKIADGRYASKDDHIFEYYELDFDIIDDKDDDIRQRIINLIKMSSEFGGFALHKWEADEMLAWIEKQGKKETLCDKCRKEHPSHSCQDITALGRCALEKQDEQKSVDKVKPKFKVKYAGSEYNVFETKDIAGVTFYGIEDEPNHIDYVKADNCEIISVYAIKENGSPYPTKPAVFSEKKPKRMISAESKEAMYNKPADKVEPKFQNGQWIVWQNKYYKVNYNGCGYELIDQNGLRTSLEYGTVDKSAHLWTIQDARDGDVLYHKSKSGIEYIVMNKGINKNNNIDSYFRYNSISGFDINVPSVLSAKCNSITPATKEQCELLFSKMKEAGYTFDFEKKELKKIEEEVNGEDYGIDGLWHAQRILEKTLGSVEGYQSDDGILEHKCAISAVKKLYEQNPAWSEEDKDYYDAIIAKIEKGGKV